MKYIGFYSSKLTDYQKRIYFTSSKNKMDYIIKVLNEIGHDVEVISPSWTLKNRSFPNSKTMLFSNNYLILGKTVKKIPFLSQLFSIIWLFIYLIRNTKKGETIIVYHSIILMLPIIIIKKLKNLNIILEVEEIYSLTFNKYKLYSSFERRYISQFRNRILVSDNLKKIVSDQNNNDIVLYGSYIHKRNNNIKKVKNSLVYAGVISEENGSAMTAVKVMEFIQNPRMKLYILGYGDANYIEKLLQEIKRINYTKGEEVIKFLGSKQGSEFDDTMNRFEYALNLQKVGKYMETAFPSKILSYLSYEQKIISTNVNSIVNSLFSKYISFVRGNSIQLLAEDIERIISKDNQTENTSHLIIKLHEKFKKELQLIIVNSERKKKK